MKKILIAIILLLVSAQLGYSQKTSAYDKYIGTWKWVDNQSQSEFIIILKMGTADWTRFGKGTKDCIIGAYRYKKTGVIIAGNTNELSEQKRYSMYPIVILGDEHYMKLYVKDLLVSDKNFQI